MLVKTESVDGTKAVAACLAPLLRSGDVLLLSGDLGAGKTAFVQGLAAALGIKEPVTSPTFTLAASYLHGRLPLHHLDAYRLESLTESLIDLDLPELLDDEAVLCIEWGEVVIPELPPNFLEIHLRLGSTDAASAAADAREIEFRFVGTSWQDRCAAVTAALATGIATMATDTAALAGEHRK